MSNFLLLLDLGVSPVDLHPNWAEIVEKHVPLSVLFLGSLRLTVHCWRHGRKPKRGRQNVFFNTAGRAQKSEYPEGDGSVKTSRMQLSSPLAERTDAYAPSTMVRPAAERVVSSPSRYAPHCVPVAFVLWQLCHLYLVHGLQGSPRTMNKGTYLKVLQNNNFFVLQKLS